MKSGGITYWYRLGIACSNHNYYWYEEQSAERMWIVAWDQDSSFNLDNTTTTMWFDWDDTSLGCRPMTHNPFLIPQRASTCDPLIRDWAVLQQRYLEATDAFLTGPFEQLRVASELAVWEEQIAPVVEEAAGVHEDALTPEAWHAAVEALRDAIDTLRERARARVVRGAIEIGDPWLIQPMDAGITKPPTTSETTTSDFDGG